MQALPLIKVLACHLRSESVWAVVTCKSLRSAGGGDTDALQWLKRPPPTLCPLPCRRALGNGRGVHPFEQSRLVRRPIGVARRGVHWSLPFSAAARATYVIQIKRADVNCSRSGAARLIWRQRGRQSYRRKGPQVAAAIIAAADAFGASERASSSRAAVAAVSRLATAAFNCVTGRRAWAEVARCISIGGRISAAVIICDRRADNTYSDSVRFCS